MRRKSFSAASPEFSKEMQTALKKVRQERVPISYSLPNQFINELRSEASKAFGMKGKSKWASLAVREFLDPSSWLTSQAGAKPWLRVISDTMIGIRFNRHYDKIDLEPDLKVPAWQAAIDSAIIASSDTENPVYLNTTIGNVVAAAVIWKLTKIKSKD